MKKIIVSLMFVLLLMACENSPRVQSVTEVKDDGTQQVDQEETGGDSEETSDTTEDQESITDDSATDNGGTQDSSNTDTDETGTEDDSDQEAECGNGIVEKGEVCDDGNNYMETSEDVDYGDQIKACNEDCTQEKVVVGPYCGDGEINGDELCDGDTVECSDIMDKNRGEATCENTCERYDISECSDIVEIVDVYGTCVPDNVPNIHKIGDVTEIRIDGEVVDGKGASYAYPGDLPIIWNYFVEEYTYITWINSDLSTSETVRVISTMSCINAAGKGVVNFNSGISSITNIELEDISDDNKWIVEKFIKEFPNFKICN